MLDNCYKRQYEQLEGFFFLNSVGLISFSGGLQIRLFFDVFAINKVIKSLKPLKSKVKLIILNINMCCSA